MSGGFLTLQVHLTSEGWNFTSAVEVLDKKRSGREPPEHAGALTAFISEKLTIGERS
jgi:hypothetical protein